MAGKHTMMHSPSAERNKDAILNILKQIIPNQPSFVLEIGSGTGQHVTHFSEHFDQVTWQPTELDEKSINSIQGYIEECERKNVLAPFKLDTMDSVDEWSDLEPGSCDMLICINVIHITEWQVTQGLFKGCGRYLKPGGILVTYGAYKVHGEITPDSNVQFDRMLRQQNPNWGLKDLDDLEKLAHENNMTLEKTFEMPSNNKLLVFRKT